MSSRTDNAARNKTFGCLLSGAINCIAACEAKTVCAIENDLGEQIGIAGKTIQRYKAGHPPPDHASVKLLAEAAVQRGYLGREWLQRFLHAARYPFADTLLDHLRPIGPTRPRPPRVYHNLPAPTYTQFVTRKKAFDEVADGLSKRSAAVLIIGMSGNGKTSLAREIAAQCLADADAVPRFDAVVWVSDKDRPGTTNLSIVLDEIARTLDYPGCIQFEYDEKRYEVEQLLRYQHVLVVVDNFETITDSALLTWLLRIPEPSKAIITSREYSRAFRNSTMVVELHGMGETEAQEFIDQRLRVLRIAQYVSGQAQLEPLLLITGGNPKAIEIALGLVKHARRPLQYVMDDLYAARGDLFDYLFGRAWSLLDEAARRVLLAMTFFPTSAHHESLSTTADVNGFSFDHAVERLTDLALLDVQHQDLTSTPRYALHPLVRAFAGAQLRALSAFETITRERWVQWYLQLAAKVSCCWDELGKLELLDSEQETIISVFEWLFEQHRYDDTIQMARSIRYYYHIRGYWDRKQRIDWCRFTAARSSGDIGDAVLALAYYIQTLSRRDEIEQVEQYLPCLDELAQSTSLPVDTFFHVQHAKGLYWWARKDIVRAQMSWEICSEIIEQIKQIFAIANRQWLATCYYYDRKLTEAENLFQKTLTDANAINDQRGGLVSQWRLAAIQLERGDIPAATIFLEDSFATAKRFQDRRNMAEIYLLFCRLHTRRGDLPAARAALAEAIDLFERLGMRRELAEARAALASLDDRERAALAG